MASWRLNCDLLHPTAVSTLRVQGDVHFSSQCSTSSQRRRVELVVKWVTWGPEQVITMDIMHFKQAITIYWMYLYLVQQFNIEKYNPLFL